MLIGATGCLVPLGHKTTLGHRHSAEALALLDLPDTTRDDVLAELGPPLWESHELRILFYLWEDSLEWYVIPPAELGLHPGKSTSHPQRWGLFIAYNEHGVLSAHEVCPIGRESPEEACAHWFSRVKSGR